MRIDFRRLLIAGLLTVLPGAPPLKAATPLQERIAATSWTKVRGVNYVPSYAANTYEIWRNYDHAAFDHELALAESVGYNSIRLWLNYAAFEELGPRLVDRVEDALGLCARHHLKAVVNLFDACGIRPRKDARYMTAGEAYNLFQNSPRFTADQKALMQHLFGNYVKGFGKNTVVPVAADTPMTILLFQEWQSTPGNDHMTPAYYSQLESYLDAIVGRLKRNPSVLLWDLMNEPEFTGEGPISPTVLITPEMEKLRDAFLKHFHDFFKRKYPDEILSIGWAQLDNAERYAQLADVLTFHRYADPAALQATIDKAVAIANKAGKPILMTETLANWDFGQPDFGRLATDEAQLEHYRKVLPVLVKSSIGWVAWGLVMSRDFDPFTDIFYPNGQPRPAAFLLEKMLKESIN